MRNWTPLLLCLLLASISVASSFEDHLENGIQVDITARTERATQVDFTFNSPEFQVVDDASGLIAVQFPGAAIVQIPGTPVVPVYSRMLRLPITGNATVVISNAEYDTYSDIEYASLVESETGDLYTTLDPAIDAWYPESIASLSDPAILRDFRVASLSITPVQVNPARGEVRVYTSIETSIEYDNSSSMNELSSYPTQISEVFLPFYREFLDWEDSELDQFTLYRGQVQVLVQNNQNVLAALEPWIEWKKQKGWDLELLTSDDVNWNRASIQAELQSRYNEAETPFEYIVIIGDALGGLTTPPGTPDPGYGAGDHPYGCLAGGDYLLDVAVGRISVSNITELVTYVNKVIGYERDPYMDETDWYLEGSACAGSSLSGISTVYVMEYAKHVMLASGYDEVHTAFYNDQQGNVNQRTISFLNEGVSFHCYRGFLNSGLTTQQILNLDNTNLLPVVIDITCGRGNWSQDLSINEAYMRAGTPTSPRGGIAAMSTATSGTHTRFNNSMVGGGVEAAFVHHVRAIGDVFMGAKLNMWNNLYPYEANMVYDFNDWLNLMGDPTVWFWTDIPRQINVNAESTVEVGQNEYVVEVLDQGSALQNAWVTLYKSDENEEVIARSVTGSDGVVHLIAPFQFAGDAILTVTAQNAQPNRQDVSVTIPEERLGYTSIEILDDGTQGTSGNGNGIADFGETVGLLPTIHNFGGSAQSNVAISVTSTDEWVENVSGTISLGTINSGADATATSPILIEISPDCPNDWMLELDLSITGSSGTYTDGYLIQVLSPNLLFVQADQPSDLEPGSSADVSFELANIGLSGSSEATLSLTSEHEWLTIETGTGTLPAIAPGQSGTSSAFVVHAAENSFEGFYSDASLEIALSDGRTETIAVQILIGDINETNPSGPDAHGYFAYENSDTPYILHPVYNWVEINPNQPGHDFAGTHLNLPDRTDDGDCAVVVDLPFDFTYYGETFTEITVCSNGWLAMGDQHEIALGRNWRIPSPLGPDGMIAPYWDDRTIPQSPGNGGVFAYTNAENGQCIIEWDRVNDAMGSNPCTFQVILYEASETNPTPTGDNEFLFQYKTLNHSTGSWADVMYWTTGIENLDQTDGLQLHYFNVEAPSAHELTDETVIFFTSRTSMITGTVYGQVTHLEDNTPVPNVLVTSSSHATADYTDENGNYQIICGVGEQTIIFSKQGYETVAVEDVTVTENGSQEINVQMARPAFTINPDYLEVTMGDDEQHIETIQIGNSGDADLAYNLSMNVYNPDVGGGLGDLQDEFVLDSLLQADMVSDGTYLWVLARYFDSNYYMFQCTMDHEPLESYIIGNYNFVNIQYVDGSFMMFSMDRVYTYTFNGSQFTQVSNDQLPDWATMSAVYDPQEQRMYILDENWLRVFDSNDQLIVEHTLAEYWYTDIEWVADDPDGYYIHISAVSFEGPAPQIKISRVDPETAMIDDLFTTSNGIEGEGVKIHIFSYPNSLAKSISLVSMWPSVVYLFNYTAQTDWYTLSPESGTVPSGSQADISITFDGPSLPVGDFTVWLSVTHSAPGSPFVLPIDLTVTSSPVQPTPDIPRCLGTGGGLPESIQSDSDC